SLRRRECRVIIPNDFLNATAGVRDRDRSISQTIHCDQSAWLELRRHERDVGARLDQMCESFIVKAAISESCWVTPGSNRESGFEAGIAFAENDQADVIREHAIEQRGENAKAFFRDYARNHSKNRSTRCRRKPHFGQKNVATNHFAR